MNERIDELMIQVGARFEFLHGVHYDDFQYRKFVELIVKQCARVAQNTDLEDIEGGDRAVLQAAGKHIKQHFGVDKMKVYQWHEVQSLAVKQVGKPAVYVSNGLEYRTPHDNEIFECVREGMKELFGDLTDEYFQALCGLITSGLFFFDTIEEQYRFYRVFEQPLVDSSPIYACTYNAQGECMTENT